MVIYNCHHWGILIVIVQKSAVLSGGDSTPAVEQGVNGRCEAKPARTSEPSAQARQILPACQQNITILLTNPLTMTEGNWEDKREELAELLRPVAA
jgi:hypothetical protein